MLSLGTIAPPAERHAAAGPFGATEIAALFAPLEDARGAVLAVSGGPDSVALMLLAASWAEERGVKAKLTVATVDHGLRPESRREADAVAGWAKAQGLRHKILTWEGEKPTTRIQQTAREARYRLLFQHTRESGADHLLSAHHADDQAETILFRLLRGSGIAGLAGMESAVKHAGLTHLRPLLGYPKDALVAVCASRVHPYLRDPSNENSAFARTRLRRLLPMLAEHGLDAAALLRLGRRAERADLALAARTEKLRAALHATRGARAFAAPIRHLADEPDEILLRLLETEIAAMSGRTLRLDRLETLIGALGSALRDGVAWRGTLGGTLLNLDGAGTLTIVPENRRRNGRDTSAAS